LTKTWEAEEEHYVKKAQANLINRLNSKVTGQLMCDTLYYLDQHTVRNFEEFTVTHQTTMTDLIKRYFASQRSNSVVSDEVKTIFEFLIYFYIEYHTPKGIEKRNVDLGDNLVETLGKIIKDKMKFLSEEILIWNYGVLSCPDLFMKLF
jgi:hypothetical protein